MHCVTALTRIVNKTLRGGERFVMIEFIKAYSYGLLYWLFPAILLSIFALSIYSLIESFEVLKLFLYVILWSFEVLALWLCDLLMQAIKVVGESE